VNDAHQPALRAVPEAYAEGWRQCDARVLVDVDPSSRPSGRLGPRCRERAWIAAVVVGTTYDDDGNPAETELARRYACIYHPREALEWAWRMAYESENGRVVVEQHERILRSDQAMMPPERLTERYIAGMPDDPDWRP
jgi:hypothetical protein